MANRKVALCIGNNDYTDISLGKLECAVNDADSIASKLESLGFETHSYHNLSLKDMAQYVGDTIDSLDGCDVFVFYYAGHGCQIKECNVLIPIDAIWNDGPYAFKQECLPLSSCIVDRLKDYPNLIKIIILDACRKFHDGSRGFSGGDFAPFSSPADSFIALATSPGCSACESAGLKHGKYTNVLLRYIDMPHVNIETVFKRVRQELVIETNGNQIPWEHTSLIKDFKLNPHYAMDGFTYCDECFGKDYRCSDANARIIADGLLDGDFNVENETISNICNYNLDSFSSDDLFFIGRCIFRSAISGYCPSYDCQRFINCLKINSCLNFDLKTHFLNGMAYESYFSNCYGYSLVSGYKEKRTIRLSVFDLLEDEQFSNSRKFIANKLALVTNRPVFIPGDERIQFFLSIDDDFNLESINYNGKSLITCDSVHLEKEALTPLKPIEQNIIKERIGIYLNCRANCIDLVFNKNVAPDQLIGFPAFDFELNY